MFFIRGNETFVSASLRLLL